MGAQRKQTKNKMKKVQYTIGIDIGGTNTEGIIYSSKGKVIKHIKVKTPQKTTAALTQISDLIKYLVIEHKLRMKKLGKSNKIRGIGIGIPGNMNKKGVLTFVPNIPCIEGVNFKKEIEKRIKKTINTKVFYENDANLFALAEFLQGAGKGKNLNTMAGIIWGTGYGCGLIINGKIHSGIDLSGGEIGHNILIARKKTMFEDLTGWKNIVKRYKRRKGKLQTKRVNEIFTSNELVAKKIKDETLDYMSINLANLMNTINPELIVLGGGLSNLNVYKELNQRTRKYCIPALFPYVRIVKYKLGDNAGLIGAALLPLM